MSDTPEFLEDRRCSVIVAPPAANPAATTTTGFEVSDFRIQFKVKKTLSKHPNTAEITITNLSENARSKMQARGSRVILRAGYRDTLRQIFVGDARFIDHVRDGTDWLTKLECGDAERAYLTAFISQSFPAGTTAADVVLGIAAKLGLDTSGINLDRLRARQFAHGYSVHGRASSELDKVLRKLVFSWSMQDGRLQILVDERDAATERIIELSSDSGLIGSPEMCAPRKKGKPAILKFRALLSAEIRPGGRVAFASVKHQGVHRILQCSHSGDTKGSEWFTDGEAEVLTK